ncbi:MAG: hypothetical protein ACI4RP_07225 [Acutalibacteraceae bacterium]
MPNENLPVESYGDNYGTINAQTQKKKGHGVRNTMIVIISLLLLFVIAAATVIILALQTPNSDKFTAQPSYDMVTTLVKSAIYDKEAEISNEELNSFIAYMLEKANNKSNQNGEEKLPIKNAAVFVHSDKLCELYSQIQFGGQTLEISGEFELTPAVIGDSIELTLKSAKIGALPVPPGMLLDYVFKDGGIAGNADFLERDGNKLYIKTSYSFEAFSQNITLEITKIKPTDNGVTLKTTSAADIILDSLESWIGSWFG